ncbi:MAG: aminopeptidase P family protein [Acetobacteraceae bacterium]|nr:aminopeptidase P family protein [Acetobacteraceae bacterium]
MTISSAEFEQRTERLRDKMKAAGLDALIIFADEYRPGHATYLTGYKPINLIEESPQLVFLVGDQAPAVLIGRLNSYAARDIIWMPDVRPIHRAEEFIPDICRSIRERPARIGLIGDNLLPVSKFEIIKRSLPKATFTSVTPLLIELRQIKSPAEVALMERAADINDAVLRGVRDRIEIGMTEIQVAGIAEVIAREMNAGLGSATLVLSGPNTNYPAWWPSERRIDRGDYVMLDFNPSYGNYTNDGGTTFLMPGATPEQTQALRLGHRILKEVIPLIRPRTPAATIYDMIFERVATQGFSDNFVPYAKGLRGVGHGVGVDVVEPPNLSSDSDFMLEPGMTLAIKFDLHGLKAGGLRAEVVILITETGVRPLNKLILDEPEDFPILT